MKNKKKNNKCNPLKNQVMKKKKKIKRSNNSYTKEQIDNVRNKQLLEANKDEDKTIKRLEKLLKIDKKKNKSSNFLMGDGLDYLLDFDNKDGNRLLTDDSDDDLAVTEREKKSFLSKRKLEEKSEDPVPKRRTLTDLLIEKEGCIAESEGNEDSFNKNEFSDSECELDYSDNSQSCESIDDCDKIYNDDEMYKNSCGKSDSKVWEDIYGRFRDEKGNIIKYPEVQKYVPPCLQKTTVDNQKNEELFKIKRNLKGLLNRLSESNLQPISQKIEEIYMKHGRNDINETLFSLIYELVLTPVQTAPRLIMEQAMLIALLHTNVGAEIGAFFLQKLVLKFDQLFKDKEYGEGKMCNNVLSFLSHLYNFKVVHAALIFDIFHKLIESFQSKDIELIQLFLKNIGFVLRKDDPISLKEIILSIQAKASSVKKEQTDSRITFMLETLTAIRNNNIYKIPDYDPTIIEHGKRVLKAYIRKGCFMQELAISYEDLIKANERGRWWIVGSAWSEREKSSTSKENQNSTLLPKSKYSEKLLELAQKQHMNTDVRKSVFCIIMTAEDYMDAFQKLLKLNLRNQEREIISVIVHCALEEKTYNPFYSYLAGKFCGFARKYQMSLQFCLWDKFKELNNMKPHQVRNLSNFLGSCFTSLALPLSVLKVIHLSEMDNKMLKFIRQILLAILLHDSEEVCIQVFKRISAGKNLNLLRESLRLFMHHFLLRNIEKYTVDVREKLTERIKIAETSLSSAKTSNL